MGQDWKVNDLLLWTREYLAKYRVEEPRLEAEVLLAFALGMDRLGLYLNHDRPVNADERKAFRELIIRRVKGEPTAYLTGHKEFMSLSFITNSNVLIPRPDTEVLVEECLRILANARREMMAADIGTGSGVIAISIARYVKHVKIFAVDILWEALDVARENATLNGVADRIEFLQGNLAEPLPLMEFDLIAANLPYVPTGDIPGLPVEVRDYEPRIALDGGLDGLDLYRALIPQAAARLVTEGYLVMEINDQKQAQVLGGILESFPTADLYVLKDLAQRERVLVWRKG